MISTSLNQISDISETLLLPLYARALESQSQKPLIHDPVAEQICHSLNQKFADSSRSFYKKLAAGKLPPKLLVSMALRTRKFDQYVGNFLEKYPEGVVVNIGCGLGTRFRRVDNGKCLWYDLDFPNVINIRKSFLEETERHQMIASSVLDFSWMDKLNAYKDRPFLFIAEGVFMYLYEKDVKELLLNIHDKFPRSELACEVAAKWIVKRMQKGAMKKRFQKKFHLGDDATFHFGVEDAQEIISWHKDFKLLDEWTYFDEDESKLGWMRLFKYFDKLKKVQWVGYYRL